MLQRLQTVYLLLASLAIGLIFVFSFCTYDSPSSLAGLTVNIYGVDFEMNDKVEDLIAEQGHAADNSSSEAEIKAQIKEFETMLDAEVDRINESKFGMVFTAGKFGVLLLLALIVLNIFLFKNRKRQLRIGRFLFLICLLVFVGVLFGASFGYNVITSEFADIVGGLMQADGDEFEIRYGIATFLPAAACAFIFLANLRIKRDEKLVSSLDRLR